MPRIRTTVRSNVSQTQQSMLMRLICFPPLLSSTSLKVSHGCNIHSSGFLSPFCKWWELASALKNGRGVRPTSVVLKPKKVQNTVCIFLAKLPAIPPHPLSVYQFFENFLRCILIAFNSLPHILRLSPLPSPHNCLYLTHQVQFVLCKYSWMCDPHWSAGRKLTSPLPAPNSCQFLLSLGWYFVLTFLRAEIFA